MRTKRILGLLLVVVLVVGMFVGCDKNETPKYGKKVNLSMFHWMLNDACKSDSELYKHLSDRLGIEITPIVPNSNNWGEKLSVAIASGEIPDIFISNGPDNADIFNQWIREGIVLNLSEYAKDYPNLKAQLEKYDALKDLQGGSMYALPIASDLSRTGFYVRKDWLDKLGLEVPKTYNELMEVMRAFALNDPDGNGVKDTYGISVAPNTWGLAHILGLNHGGFSGFYKNKEGYWESKAVSDNNKQAVKDLVKMYKDGVLSPEFTADTDTQKVENFVGGKSGVMRHNGYSYYAVLYNKFREAYPNIKDVSTMFEQIPYPSDMNGEIGDTAKGYWMFTCINATAGEEKIKKSLELLDFLLSEEGREFVFYGLEGVHFKREGDKRVSLLPLTKDGVHERLEDYDKTMILKDFVTWEELIADDNPHKEAIEKSHENCMYAVEIDPLLGIKYDENIIDAQLFKELENFANEEISKMVVNGEDVDAVWDDFKAEYYKRGGKIYEEETNKLAKERGV